MRTGSAGERHATGAAAAARLDSSLPGAEANRKTAAAEAAAFQAAADAQTEREAWDRYMAERRPHWCKRIHTDHMKTAQEGGNDRQRMPGCKTKPGPMAALTVLLIDANHAPG